MGVRIINVTGNRVGFENDFCEQLKTMLEGNAELLNLRGQELLDAQIIEEEGAEIVVLVAHAGPNTSESTQWVDTILECGYGFAEADNPTVFFQQLERNSKRFIMIYCACEALSPETCISGIEDKNCVGIIASLEPILATHVGVMSKVINMAYSFIINNEIDTSTLERGIRKIVKENGGHPNLYFQPMIKIQVEE